MKGLAVTHSLNGAEITTGRETAQPEKDQNSRWGSRAHRGPPHGIGGHRRKNCEREFRFSKEI